MFTETKALDLTNRFRRDADAFYVEAKRSTVSGVAQIPYWVYGLFVVLGWNEAMVVLFNPLYFAMLLVLAATACVVLSVLPIIAVADVVLQVDNHSARNGWPRTPNIKDARWRGKHFAFQD